MCIGSPKSFHTPRGTQRPPPLRRLDSESYRAQGPSSVPVAFVCSIAENHDVKLLCGTRSTPRNRHPHMVFVRSLFHKQVPNFATYGRNIGLEKIPLMRLSAPRTMPASDDTPTYGTWILGVRLAACLPRSALNFWCS